MSRRRDQLPPSAPVSGVGRARPLFVLRGASLSAPVGTVGLPCNAVCLTRQTPITGYEGWGESDVEERDAALERVYPDRAAAKPLAHQARHGLLANGRTESEHVKTLRAWLLANAA